MTRRDIEDAVADNQRDIARSFATDRRPAARQDNAILLSPVPVDVAVDVEVYTRPLNDTLTVGNPNASNGWARGAVGDYRGSWTKQETVSTSLTRDGRQAIADALQDATTEIDAASTGDATVNAWGIDDGNDTTRGRASFRFDESPATVTAADLRTNDSRIIADGSVNVSVGNDTEARVDVTMTFSDGSRNSNEKITNISTVADAIKTDDQAVTLDKLAIGTDDTDPTTSDTALGSEQITKAASQSRQGQASILQTTIFRSEPAGQPYDFAELGVIDDDGNLVTRVVFATRTKDDKLRLRARNGVLIK